MTQNVYPSAPAGGVNPASSYPPPPPPPASPYAAYPSVGYGPGQSPVPMVVRTNTLAVVTLITALVGFVGLPVILGHLALGAIKRTGERGYALAVIGLVLGYMELAFVLVAIWLAIAGSLGW
jgi:hypothetical protein